MQREEPFVMGLVLIIEKQCEAIYFLSVTVELVWLIPMQILWFKLHKGVW